MFFVAAKQLLVSQINLRFLTPGITANFKNMMTIIIISIFENFSPYISKPFMDNCKCCNNFCVLQVTPDSKCSTVLSTILCSIQLELSWKTGYDCHRFLRVVFSVICHYYSARRSCWKRSCYESFFNYINDSIYFINLLSYSLVSCFIKKEIIKILTCNVLFSVRHFHPNLE